MGRISYKKWEKNYPKVAKKYTEDKCLKCAKVPLRLGSGPSAKMPKVGKAKERKQKGKEHREKKVKGKRTKEKEFPAVGPRPFESLKVCDRAFG